MPLQSRLLLPNQFVGQSRFCAELFQLRQLSVEQRVDLLGRATQSDVELPEQGVDGADVVEAHFVDQLLEDQRVVGEKVDAPLPIVEADGAGDDLLYFSSVTAADHAMFAH